MRLFFKLIKAVTVIISTLLSGIAYYFSSYFNAIWWLAWLAPVPILVYAFKSEAWPTLVAALIVGCAPGLNQLIGYLPTKLPMNSAVQALFIGSIEFTIIVMITRLMVRRFKLFIIFPLLIILKEFIESYTINGSFNTLAYSQLKFLPALQIGALGSYIAISFILSLFAANIAFYICYRQKSPKIALSSLVVGLLVPAISLAYGYYCLNNESFTRTVRVALISEPTLPSVIYNTHDAMKLAKMYVPEIKSVSREGAKIVLIPEESMTVYCNNATAIKTLFSNAAKDNHVYIIVGINQHEFAKRYNTAWVFDNHGNEVGQYNKRHFVPIVEAGITPGKKLLTFQYKNYLFGVALCRDMDYRYPSRAYAKLGVNMMFVPAWDFNVDQWVHANGALMRGVDNQYTVVRAARDGYLSISSKTGRLIAIKSDIGNVTTLVANAPIARLKNN